MQALSATLIVINIAVYSFNKIWRFPNQDENANNLKILLKDSGKIEILFGNQIFRMRNLLQSWVGGFSM